MIRHRFWTADIRHRLAAATPGSHEGRGGTDLQPGGWQSLQTRSGRAFRGPFDCVLYALRGGTFGTIPPSPPPEETPPPAE